MNICLIIPNWRDILLKFWWKLVNNCWKKIHVIKDLRTFNRTFDRTFLIELLIELFPIELLIEPFLIELLIELFIEKEEF